MNFAEDHISENEINRKNMIERQILVANSYLLLPSPYLVSPSPCYITNHYLLSLVLHKLTDWKLNRELAQTEEGETLIKYRQFVAGEFYRRVVDSELPLWKPEKPIEEAVSLEADLWIATFEMLERMSKLVPFTEHSAINLYTLISERALMVLVATFSGGVIVAKEYIANLQSQNRRLQGCENPFDSERVPRTWKTIHEAIALADTNDSFRRDFYMPVVRARQKLVIQMKNNRARVFYKGKMQRQGRRKTK